MDWWRVGGLAVLALVAVLLVPATFSQPPSPVATYGSTWEQSCIDGQCRLTVYASPRFFEDAGQWLPIDEAFAPCGDGYCVDKNLYRTEVSGSTVTLTRGQDRLSFTILSVGGASLPSPSVDGNALSYALPGATLLLTYFPTAAKEEVVLAVPPVADFTITYALEQAGSSFVVAEPWACDAKEDCIALETATDGPVSTVTVPQAWLATAVYPVVIDPTILLNSTAVPFNGYVTQDTLALPATYTRTSNPSRAHEVGFEGDLFQGINLNHRAVFEFNLSALPKNATVTEVLLQVNLEAVTATNANLALSAMLGNGSSYPNTNNGNKLFWQDMGNGTLFASANLTPGTTGLVNWSLTGSWADAERAADANQSLGVGIKSSGEGAGGTVNTTRISSRDDSNVSQRPVLTITYRYATEHEGDLAILQGIASSLPAAPVTSDQQVYQVTSAGQHATGRFDQAARSGNQTWAFNYVTENESATSMPSLSTLLNVWENSSLFWEQIASQVETFINQTMT